MKPQDFEEYLNNIEFDDKPSDAHRDQLEQKLLAHLSGQPKNKNNVIWKLNSGIFKFSAAAMIIITILIGLNSLNGTTAWAKVIEALNNADNVHITEIMHMPNGEEQRSEWWFKKPALFMEDEMSYLVIDNGSERLTINKQSNSAQFSDSWLPYRPIVEHYMYKQIELFRNEDDSEIKLMKLPAESNELIIVYAVKDQDSYEDKVWVQADTMLPLRMTAKRTGDVQSNEPNEAELIFSYNTIDETLFAMDIPFGYTELPRKLTGAITGKIIDEQSVPVAEAIVHIVDNSGNYSETTQTDEYGNFLFKLRPEYIQPSGLWLPVMFRAYKPDDPNNVAWTIIKDITAARDPNFYIPGEIGYVEIKDRILNSASGIILKMEPAAVLTGSVSDIDGNNIPYAEITVACHPVDQYGNEGDYSLVIRNLGGTGNSGLLEAIADKNGRYIIGNLPRFWDKTRWIVYASGPGYVADNISFRSTGALDRREIDFDLYEASIEVAGTLRDNYNQPLANRMIYARVDSETYRRCYTKTDEKGNFTLEGCPASENLEVFSELSHDAPYYPDVTVDVGYEEGENQYEVEMIAQKPELVIEVEVKDSSGNSLPYFPVELRSDSVFISSNWKAEKNLTLRTDNNGYCKFVEVPKLEGLKLVLYGTNGVWNDTLSEDEKENIKQKYGKYKWTEVPIDFVEGQKKYKVQVTILTEEESKD